ncbi:MAG TPA: hypothetical protein VM261_27580 [Kofleriaceae bacterium]|nr:hypothetical protein [Kofleriaceae bacterium]
MPRAWHRALICLALAIAPAVASADGGPQRSKLGFRATVDKEAKRIRASGVPVEEIGPYRVGGVDVMRFVRTDKAGEWLAVHVWRAGGVTWISLVPRPLDEPRSTE